MCSLLSYTTPWLFKFGQERCWVILKHKILFALFVMLALYRHCKLWCDIHHTDSDWLCLKSWMTEASLTGLHVLMTWFSIPVMDSALFRFNQKFYKRSELDTIIAAIVRSVSRERSLAPVKKIDSFSREWGLLMDGLGEKVGIVYKMINELCGSTFG